MAEAVASRTYRACTTEEARRREQLGDLSDLVERFIERVRRLEREKQDVEAERDRLREELKRLKGE
jgi:hypothetical protein